MSQETVLEQAIGELAEFFSSNSPVALEAVLNFSTPASAHLPNKLRQHQKAIYGPCGFLGNL